MARTLTTGLQSGLRRGLQVGLGGGDFFTTASLDLNFARYKTLDPRVTFTRASSGTYVGSDGLIKTATTNLLLRSEEFDNAIWTKANITATSNQTTAPDGSANADLIAGNTGTALKYIYQSYSAATSGAFTFSVFAKAGTESFIVVRVTDQGGVNEVRQQFNLSSGAVSGSVVVNGTATTASSSINPVGNGWYQCVVTATFAAFTQLQGNVWLNSYAAVSLTTNFYLWGAQLEQSSTVGEYIPTTSTTNSAPRFDHAITSSVTNLLLRSEEFDNAYWTKNNSCTITQNDTTAPNGTLTADRFNGAALSSTGVYVIPTTISGLVYTFSVYVKNLSGATSLRLGIESNPVNAFVTFNAATGVISSQGANVTSSSVQATGDGWYRVAVTYTATGSSVGVVIYSTSGLVATWYTWGAQLEQSANVGTYVPTTAAAATSNTTESLGLLVEEQRTNLLSDSENFASPWGLAAATRTADAGTAPNGTLTADRIESTGGGVFRAGAGVANATAYTYSVFLKHVSGTGVISNVGFERFGATPLPAQSSFNVQTGVIVSNGASVTASSITAYGNGWYRVTVTATSTDTTTTVINYASTSGNQFLIWGAQLEAGAFPTSYIPTTTAAATRSADVASNTGTAFSSWYRQDEGTFYADVFRQFAVPATDFPVVADCRFGTGINQFSYLTEALAGTFVAVSGVTQSELYTGGLAGVRNRRLAHGYAANNFAATANGSIPLTDTSGSVPTISAMSIGSVSGNTQFLNGTIRRLVYWGQRLPNNVLQAITQ